MNFLKYFLNFYINSSIHVALAVFSLMKVTEVYIGYYYNDSLNYFVFFASIIGYNFVKHVRIKKKDKGKKYVKNLKVIYVTSIIAFTCMIYYALQLKLMTLLFFVPFSLITFLYAIPFYGKEKLNLRSFATAKIIMISFVWAGVTVFALPVETSNFTIDYKLVLLFFQRFLFIIVLTLPFDIRDLQHDKRRLQTIPQLLGVARTKKLGYVLLLLIIIVEFLITPTNETKVVFIVVQLALFFLLQNASIRQPKYYSSFFVEAVPVFWWVLLLVFN